MGAPHPTTGIFGGWRILVGVEARKIHPPGIPVIWRQFVSASSGQDLQSGPWQGKLYRPSLIAVFVVVKGAPDMNGLFKAWVIPVPKAYPPAPGVRLISYPVKGLRSGS